MSARPPIDIRRYNARLRHIAVNVHVNVPAGNRFPEPYVQIRARWRKGFAYTGAESGAFALFKGATAGRDKHEKRSRLCTTGDSGVTRTAAVILLRADNRDAITLSAL